jgi:hypothetical protein
MRVVVSLFLICFCLTASATKYYVKTGGNNSLAGTSDATAWADISKVNSVWSAGSFAPGDSILFRCGDTFTGQIVPQESGTSSARIFIGSYSTGAKPIISGLTTITGWTNISGNIWESTSTVSTLATLNMVTINGVEYAMGRYPNAGTANGGYLNFESHTSDSVLFDAQMLPATKNVTGMRAVVRTLHYVLDTSTVENHTLVTISGTPHGRIDLTSSKIYLTVPSELSNNYGYFLQNDSTSFTLDQHGEWFYSISRKKLRIYTSANPSGYTIKVATADNLLSLLNDDYLTFKGLSFQGSNGDMVNLSSSVNYVTFDSCDFYYAGNDAVNSNSSTTSNTTFTYCNFSDVNNQGIDYEGSGDTLKVRFCDFNRMAIHQGQGGMGVEARTAVFVKSGKGHDLCRNRLDSLGFNGIRFFGLGTRVDSNHIDYFNLVLDDGGGIAIQGGQDSTVAEVARPYRSVRWNVIDHGIGAKEGTAETYGPVSGIYMDDNTSGVDISYNTIANCERTGVYIHNSWNIDIKYNNIFNCGSQSSARYGIHMNHDVAKNHEIRGMVVKHNVILAKSSSQVTMYLTNGGLSGQPLDEFGTIDSNYYCRPINETTLLRGRNLTGAAINYTLAGWRSATVHDDNSGGSPITYFDSIDYNVRIVYNPNATDSTVSLSPNTYKTAQGTNYNTGSVILAPFSSLILFKTPQPIAPTEPTIYRILRYGHKVFMRKGSSTVLGKPED